MNIKKSILTLSLATAVSAAGMISSAAAEEDQNAENANAQSLELAMKAMPELADELQKPAENKAAPRMKCYVDTPAYDYFTYGYCFSAGHARTTTAVFNVENVVAGSQVLWSNSNCTNNQTTCFVPINQYQSKTVTATVLNPNGTYTQTSATAEYEGFF